MTDLSDLLRKRLLDKYLRTSRNLVAVPLKAEHTLENGEVFDHLIVGRELQFDPSTFEEIEQFVGISFSRGISDEGLCTYHINVLLDKSGKALLLNEEQATFIGDTEERVFTTYRDSNPDTWKLEAKVNDFDDYLSLLEGRPLLPVPTSHRLRTVVQLGIQIEGCDGPR